MYQNIAKYILQCTLELHDIWNVQNVTRKVGKERLYKNLRTIYGYEFTKFEEYFKNYYHNFESKEKFDNIVNIIYAQYRKEVEEKEKMKKII